MRARTLGSWLVSLLVGLACAFASPAVAREIAIESFDVDLTVGEFRIVHLLARNVGQYVGYRAIYDEVRHRGFISGNGENGYRTNVRSAVKRIRRKFEKHDPHFDEIHNFMAFGYVWGRRANSKATS